MLLMCMLLLFMSTPRTSSLYPYYHCYHDWQYGCSVLVVSADAACVLLSPWSGALRTGPEPSPDKRSSLPQQLTYAASLQQYSRHITVTVTDCMLAEDHDNLQANSHPPRATVENPVLQWLCIKPS